MENQATYTPEDNKLRLYVGRVPRDEYLSLRAEGWKSTPKQDCDFVATWTPAREDTALEYADEIEDEDQSPEDRAADRAERFSMYRDKRRAEAHGHADTFDAGPAVHGYQSQARGERAARKHDRSRANALSQWSKAEYWQHRTEGVIAHALYQSEPGVRRGRILRLEKELRLHLKNVEQSRLVYTCWLDAQKQTDPEKAFKMAYSLANRFGNAYDYEHPRTGRKSSLYSLMTDPEDAITGSEAVALRMARYEDGGPNGEGSKADRWTKHLQLRLAYENQMLEADGGKAAEVEMIPGGFIGKHQIHAVNRSPITKLVTSVKLMAEKPWYRGEPVLRDDGTYGAPLTLQSFNIQRLGESAYRAPTDEELESFKAKKKTLKAKTQKANASKPKLINPTLEDAQRLQDTWNTGKKEVAEVRQMTQAEYSAKSKGSYSRYETVGVTERSKVHRCTWNNRTNGSVMFKIRTAPNSFNVADSVVVLTDKPQKPIPWAAMQAEVDSHLTEAEIVERADILRAACARSFSDHMTEEESHVFKEAIYRGMASCRSMSQFGLTDKGHEILGTLNAKKAGAVA